MDDRYFSDKSRKSQPEGRDKYTKADYFDENFSLNFRKGQGNAQSFSKREAVDDDSFTSFAAKAEPENEPENIDGLFSGTHPRRPEQELSETVRRIPRGAVVSDREAHSASGAARRPASAPVSRPVSHAAVPPSSAAAVESKPSQSVRGKSVKTKKRKKKAVAFKVIVAVLLTLIIAAGGVVFYLLNSIDKYLDKGNYDDTIINDRYLSSDAPTSDEIVNILLIGSDEREEGSSVKGKRSDTMILLTVDSANGQIKLTSFLRDSYVSIPYTDSEGNEKIVKGKMNSAYSKAGAQGVMDTIEYNFGIDVHDYVSVDFTAFEKIVDRLGGVTVDGVTEKEAKYMNREADTEIKAGKNHMNGYEALWYCRIRKLDSDFYRTQRQRKVLSAIIDKLKADPDKVLDILDKVMPYVTTSMLKDEIKSMGMKALNYVSYEVVQQQIPADGTWRDGSVNGSYVIDFDIDENKALLQDFVYKKVEKTEE